MKTKYRNILLILAMALGLLIAMSTVVFADDGPDAWTDGESLPTESGTYYLEDNVSLEDCYDVPSEAVITIDLNGKEISGLNGDKDQILILVDGKLTITDTKGNGRIESHNAVYTIWVSNGGEFNLSGGLIYNYDHDTAVYSKNATINISGGEIEVGGVSLHIYAIEDDGGSTIMVSGGTFLTEIKLGNGTTFTATGGEFRGGIINNGASFSLSGGIYSDPDGVDYRDWVSDGFMTVYIGDGYSEVVKGVSSITLEKKWMDVTEGERKALQATVLPEDAYNRDVIWSSDNEAVATVSDEGVVFGKSCGEVTITAKPDGQPGKNVSNDELTATCDVTVYPDIWWKKADNKLYLRAGQEEGYTGYHGGNPWGREGYNKVIVESTIRSDDMSYWFNGAEDLEEIVNPENIDTGRVTSMFCLFNGCKKLQSLDLSTWNTSSVTDMRNMFQFCKALTELDLTSFDVSKVEQMGSMFEGCGALENIFVKAGTDWKAQATQLTDSGTNMFNYCKKLTGEQGTTYAENRNNADYARLDGGENAPGYFAVPLKVTFEDGMGNVIATKNARNGGSVTAPADPTREGYVFGGWDQDFSYVTSDLTVTPKWKKIIAIPTGKTLTYNGKSQTGVAADVGYTLTGTAKATNAGSYTSTATLNTSINYIYIWADGSTTAKTIKWKINKAAQSITKVTPASKTYKAVKKTKKLGKTYTFTLKTTGKGNGKVTFKKANKAGASKITVSKAGKVTIKKGLKKGTYKVKVKASKAANTNYTAAAKTVIVKIIVK